MIPKIFFALPALPEIERDGSPTREFGKIYTQLHRLMIKVYHDESHWKWGKGMRSESSQKIEPSPADPQLFIQERYRQSDAFSQELTRELALLLTELEWRRWKVNGLHMREDQIGHLFYVLASLCTGKRGEMAAILLRNPPGSGKTIELGVCNEAFLRWQDRRVEEGEDPKIGAFVTAKPTHMAQQAFGAQQRILRSPPYTVTAQEISRYYRDIAKLYGDKMQRCISRKVWSPLFTGERGTAAGAEIVRRSLQDRNRLEEFEKTVPNAHACIEQIGKLIDGSHVIVRGIYNHPDLIAAPPIPPLGEKDRLAYGGDATYGIPASDFPIHVGRKEWRIMKNSPEPKDAVATPRFLLLTSGSFTGHRSREAIGNLLKGTVFITLDEAVAMNPLQFATPVREAGGKQPPVIIAASGKDQLVPLWTRSPSLSIPEAVERGILPNIGFRLIGTQGRDVHGSGTEEAYAQFEGAFFKESLLLKQLGEKQPWQRNSLIVVPPSTTREVAHRLERQLKERNLPGKVLCHDGKSGNDKEGIQLWFVNEQDQPDQLPHFAVSTTTNMGMAVHLENIELCVAMAKMNEHQLMQLFGRLTHSMRHRRGPQNYRALFWQQLLSDMNPELTILRLLEDQGLVPKNALTWVDDHCIMGSKAYEADREKTQGGKAFPSSKIPSAMEHRAKTEKRGTPLEATAPSLGNTLEAELYNTPCDLLSIEAFMQYAEERDRGFYAERTGSYRVSMEARVKDYIAEARRKRFSGNYVLLQMKRAMKSIDERRRRVTVNSPS
ncbi:hypothetical protein HY213_00410 [Candidatus Peregrinibacteria bacterium]|nr:hypothetical protein [Candidatus Peregrinibacteria bacterium]